MEPSEEDIRFVETSPTEGLMPTPIIWEYWAIGGFVLLVLLLAAWFMIRAFFKPKLSSPEDLKKKAHRDALAALSACPKQELIPAATECSLVLRRYLAAVTSDPALYETHDEWIARHDALETFEAQLKQQIHHLFEQLARWKYAPSDEGDEPAQVISRSRDLLESINQEVTS